jgi:uncharacterized damage-inducible protein DinB
MEQPNAKAFADYWNNIRSRTRRVAACIPPDKIEWAPGPDRWSFGDMIRHLAGIERYMYVENAQRKPNRYPGHGRELADGFDAIMEYEKRLHDESMAILAGLSDADMIGKCETPGATQITTWKWLRAMVEHEAHHRGQIYLMLGLLGVKTPPIFTLTEEEVAARARAARSS